ncbi:MAG: NAD(P)H-dependent glycerol-3-phosphate dehydrogenase, partial [Burkholderiaceae bacterium]
AKVLALPTFRIYQTDDVRGVELGGSLKNVLAIACGISDGFGFGESARAALITRGFAELFKLSIKMGARPETLMGLAGLGDLLLTCNSQQSRNHSFGYAIGRGATPAAAIAQCRGVVEGAATAAIAVALAVTHNTEMPIVNAVHAIVDGGAEPATIIRDLLARPALTEFK